MINSVESCERYIRSFYQGNVFKCIKDSQNIKEVNHINKNVYFILPKIENNEKNDNNRNSNYTNKNNLNSSMNRKIDYSKIMKKTGKKKGLYKSNKIIL